MNFADNPLIRRTLAPQPSPDPYAEPRERLWRALLQFRERAATLANEIHRDLPDFTVHDITHLDALWEMADLIAGPDYPLNPLEAFALGAVFLLHDLGLGLAAWPGGLDELKKGPGWQDALSTYLRKHLERIPTAEELASPPPEIERTAVQERLRVLHAEQAERLAFASWSDKRGGPEYHLIEDPDLRQAIGSLLGKIAHSHWWPVSHLGSEFGTVRGSLSWCHRDWTLDPLKIAVLLRTADAAHLDERRAPGFLIALRRPEGISEDHWHFQNHLLKPQVEDDRLVYTTARPFPPEEANAWWLCEETLRSVDRELHQVDALLADRGYSPRLKVRSVAGVESPERLRKYVEVSAWTPVDARLHVSHVADLVQRLGGDQLYGEKPYVPLRELIQNALDAIHARRLLQDRPADWGRITARLGRDEQGSWVEVEDTGVGMSSEVLSGPLLDFGKTYWGSDLMREEHVGLWAKGFDPIGRFGVGFFSTFMWGHRVRVITRRYDESLQDTRILEFQTGLQARPLMRPATKVEQLEEGGTLVRVWLKTEPLERWGGLLSSLDYDQARPIKFRDLCAWLAPAIDVDLYVEDERGSSRVVAASDWLTIGGVELLARLSMRPLTMKDKELGACLGHVRSSGGEILGRAALRWRSMGKLKGVITVRGLRAELPEGELVFFVGVLSGYVTSASRGEADYWADYESIARWATEQAGSMVAVVSGSEDGLKCSELVVFMGGNPGNLPVARRGSVLVNKEDIACWQNAPDEVIVCIDDGERAFLSNVLVFSHVWSLNPDNGMTPDSLMLEALSQAWKCPQESIKISRGVESIVGYDVGIDITSDKTIILRRPA